LKTYVIKAKLSYSINTVTGEKILDHWYFKSK